MKLPFSCEELQVQNIYLVWDCQSSCSDYAPIKNRLRSSTDAVISYGDFCKYFILLLRVFIDAGMIRNLSIGQWRENSNFS